MIQLEDVTLRLGGRLVLDRVTATIPRGGLTVVVGPNGVGKTTLLRCILGEYPHKGRITVTWTGSGRIGTVPQFLDIDPSLPLTVAEFLRLNSRSRPLWYGTGRAERERLSEMLRLTGAEHLIDRRVGRLSGGEFRRVVLAQALSPMPELLLLDEPASSIDARGTAHMEMTIQEIRANHGVTVLMVGHDIARLLGQATTVLALQSRLLFAGSPAEFVSSGALAHLYGTGLADHIASEAAGLNSTSTLGRVSTPRTPPPTSDGTPGTQPGDTPWTS